VETTSGLRNTRDATMSPKSHLIIARPPLVSSRKGGTIIIFMQDAVKCIEWTPSPRIDVAVKSDQYQV
jgi:hypothetical protein